jgi:hypothetical protein
MWRVLRSEHPVTPCVIWGISKEDAGMDPRAFYRRYSMYRAVSSATSRPKRVSTM